MTEKSERLRDANQLAKLIVDVATDKVEDAIRSTSQQRLAGSLGGATRA